MRPKALPSMLGDTFTTTEARAAGVADKRLRARDLARPFHGVRTRRDRLPDLSHIDGAGRRRTVEALHAARLYSVRMSPEEFFTHVTAALIWGIPLPRLNDVDPHLGVFAPHRHPRSNGIHGHECRRRTTAVVVHPDSGLRVASPATTWAMLGSVLTDPYDLVAAADYLVRIPRMPGGYARDLGSALATIPQLEAVVAAGRRVGRPALRAALARVRTGASSRPETWVRLILVDHGLPEPELDVDVYDDAGTFLGCVDLAYPRLMVAIEYEGDHHRTDPRTWNRDLDKHDALVRAGWRVIRVSRHHVFQDPGSLVARVRHALVERR